MSVVVKADRERRRAMAHRPATTGSRPAAADRDPLFRLQRQAGNLAVQELLARRSSGGRESAPPWGVPAALVVGAADSPLERAADQAADQVLRMRSPTALPGGEPGAINRFAAGRGTATPAPEIVRQVLSGGGHPIEPRARQFFESRFGRDLSAVRVHSDQQAAASARSIDALAYTVGSHIVLGSGRHTPETDGGRRLLAHELAHVALGHGTTAPDLALRQTVPPVPQQAGAGGGQGPSSTRYVAHPSALADCVGILRRLYELVGPATLHALRRYKTVAVGMVVERQHPEVGRLVWTANGNWNDPVITSTLAALNVQRADPGRSRVSRGATGAPGDAEQRMLEDAEDAGFVVKAMAVSRELCADCSVATAEYGREHGQVLIGVILPPEQLDQAQALAAVAECAQRLRSQLELYSSEHRAQSALITTPSFSGFAGFWTNRLFNREMPPPTIWVNAFAALAAVNSSIQNRDVRRALANLIRARRQYLLAMRQYVAWKDGIETAGRKAQVTIGLIAIGTILAVVAPAAVAALARPDSAVAAQQAAVRIAAIIAEADQVMLATEAAMTEVELVAEAGLETELLLGL
jgi:Domain of unknown function (DUF4157)